MLVPALLVAGAANAAEIYNKNGNKLGGWKGSYISPLRISPEKLQEKAAGAVKHKE